MSRIVVLLLAWMILIEPSSLSKGPGTAHRRLPLSFERNLGQTDPEIVSATYIEGFLGNSAGETKVFFDGIQAPMIYALEGQASAIVPYSVSDSTRLSVEYRGRRSNEVTLVVSAAAPGTFTYGGTTRAVVVNQDGTLNSDSRPAPRGSIVTFFATGEGQTSPPGIDGKLPTPPDYPVPAGPLTVTIGGIPGEVQFLGLVYAGVLQANVRVPGNAPVGSAVRLVLSIAGASSSPGAIMAVQ